MKTQAPALLALLAIAALARNGPIERPTSRASSPKAPPAELPIPAPREVDTPRPAVVLPPVARAPRLDPPPFTGGPYSWRRKLALSPEQEDRIWDLWMARQAELDALASLPDPDAFVAEIEERYEAAAEAFLDSEQRKRYRELVLETRLGLERDGGDRGKRVLIN